MKPPARQHIYPTPPSLLFEESLQFDLLLTLIAGGVWIVYIADHV